MTETRPHTISIADYAQREAEKEALPCLGDRILYGRQKSAAAARNRDKVGQWIMAGSVRAYEFIGGIPHPVAVEVDPRHRLVVQLAAWLDGKRKATKINVSDMYGSYRGEVAINDEWITQLHIEDADIAAELAAAKVRIAELDQLVENGGIIVYGKEPPELLAAMDLYRAVAGSPLPEGKKPAQALLDKADELRTSPTAPSYFKGLSQEGAKRLAIVCNWDKAPGRKTK